MRFKNDRQRKAVMAKLNLYRVPYGRPDTPKANREYKLEGKGPVGTIKEWKDRFPKAQINVVDNNILTPDKIESIRQKLDSGRTLHFQTKEARDEAYNALKSKYNLRRSSSKYAQLHPEYVEDWKGNVETGIGNVQYKTIFSPLYNLEIRR